MSTVVLLRSVVYDAVNELAEHPDVLAALRANPTKTAAKLKIKVRSIFPSYLTWKSKHERVTLEPLLFEAIVGALRELRPEEAPLLDLLAPTSTPRVLSIKTARRLGALFRFVDFKSLRPKVLATLPTTDEKTVTKAISALKKVTAAFALYKQGAILVLDEPTPKNVEPDDQIDSK